MREGGRQEVNFEVQDLGVEINCCNVPCQTRCRLEFYSRLFTFLFSGDGFSIECGESWNC
jgi:hypothetical protein